MLHLFGDVQSFQIVDLDGVVAVVSTILEEHRLVLGEGLRSAGEMIVSVQRYGSDLYHMLIVADF